jgi:predicted NAD-dependent protein-ADP-ribosyltransferase YbiA (DUF1768 family)
MSTIFLNSTYEPYGPLSNNYQKTNLISKGTERWSSVTHFIYCKLLDKKKDCYINKKKASEVLSIYNEIVLQEENETLFNSYTKALRIKVENNPELKNILMLTGNSPILYHSSNPILGVIQDNQSNTVVGQNLYGKMLEQLRHSLKLQEKNDQQSKVQEEFENKLYLSYNVYINLQNAIYTGDDLEEDIVNNITLEQINSRHNNILSVPKQQVMQYYNNNNINPIVLLGMKEPKLIPLYLRKENLSRVPKINTERQKQIIFDMYFNYMIYNKDKDISVDNYKVVRYQTLNKLSVDEKNNIEKRVAILFYNNKLPEDLTKNIKEKIKKIKIPSFDQINYALQIEIPKYNKILVEPEPTSYVDDNKSVDPIIIFEIPDQNQNQYRMKATQKLSPISDDDFIHINGYDYPSISIYSAVQLLLRFMKDLKKAYNVVLKVNNNERPLNSSGFKSLENIWEEYRKLKEEYYNNNRIKYFKLATDIKFQDKNLQRILLSTGKSTLIWNQPNNQDQYQDLVFGKNRKGGQNIVGKYLEKLRETFKKDWDSFYLSTTVDDKYNIYLLAQEPFMEKWITMRVNEMCRTIMSVKTYMNQDKITKDFVQTTINLLYNPCSVFSTIGQFSKINTPSFFYTIVTRNRGFKQDVVEVFWKHTVVMLFYLLKYMQHEKFKNIQKIEQIINNIQQTVSKETNCVKIITNENENCILSALLNLLIQIKKLKTSCIENNDIDLATDIILDNPYKKRNNPLPNNTYIIPTNNKEIVAISYDQNPNVSYVPYWYGGPELVDSPNATPDLLSQFKPTVTNSDKLDETDYADYAKIIDSENNDTEEDGIEPELDEAEYSEFIDIDPDDAIDAEVGLVLDQEYDENGEQDYGDVDDNREFFGDGDGDGDRFGFSVTRDDELAVSRKVLINFPKCHDIDKTEEYIIKAIKTIYNSRVMKKIKQNRINFFANLLYST